jgi:hypothetical protein
MLFKILIILIYIKILLKSFRIGHNNKGLSANWHLDHVKIESKKDGRLWLCECNRWLSKEKDDKKIERELLAIEIDNYNPNSKFYNSDNV